jgi:multimeric flavodoxin WrbA
LNILALIGSPRKGSNTDILVERFLEGCRTRGHICEKLYLYDYDISPCIDCRKCKKDDFICTIDDGMQELYPKMDHADLIAFGTPIYWYGPSAKMKLLVDRIRPYVANGKLRGKKAVVITPAGDGASACGPMVEMFRMSFEYLHMELMGQILATAYEREEIKENEKELKKAYDLGISV